MKTQSPTPAERARALTDRGVAGLQPRAQRYTVRDGLVRGLGVRVSPNGTKTFSLQYWIGRQKKRWTIGVYDTVSLALAREKARDALTALAAEGIDPAAEKRASRDQATFAELAKAYLKHAKKKKKSWDQDEATIDSVLLPVWKHRAVKEITRRDVKDLFETIVDRGAPVRANRVVQLVSAMFNYGVDEEWLTNSPAYRIKKEPETSRERVLTDEEIRELWAALEAAKVVRRVTDDKPAPSIPPITAVGLQVQLLVAQRPGEVFQMRWADLELPKRWEDPAHPLVGVAWWTIGGLMTKNSQPHRVPILPEVIVLLREAKALAARDDPEPFVFPGETHGTSVAARAKKAMASLRRTKAITFDARRHDLRRTAASGMGAEQIPRANISYVLNHVDHQGARSTIVYDRFQRDKEKTVALQAWTRRLTGILEATDGDGGVVLTFAKPESA